MGNDCKEYDIWLIKCAGVVPLEKLKTLDLGAALNYVRGWMDGVRTPPKSVPVICQAGAIFIEAPLAGEGVAISTNPATRYAVHLFNSADGSMECLNDGMEARAALAFCAGWSANLKARAKCFPIVVATKENEECNA